MKKPIRWKRLSLIILIFLAAFGIKQAIFASYVVEGRSMEPTLEDGNMLMVNRFADSENTINRFDVIVFHANEEEDYVKRVIGLPGDTIEVKQDKLYINGTYQQEEYLDAERKQVYGNLTENFKLEQVTGEKHVPEGMLFVMGDNRQDSLDSRSFGFVPIEHVVGKVNVSF